MATVHRNPPRSPQPTAAAEPAPPRARAGRQRPTALLPRQQLLSYLEERLQLTAISDPSYNGLQFEGRPTVRRIVTGVDATTAFLRRAATLRADLAIVHHGIFWKGGEWRRIDRFARAKLRVLEAADLNLVAIHLPLDLHPDLGNNASIARRLGATIVGPFADFRGVKVGVVAELPRPISAEQLCRELGRRVAPVIGHLAPAGRRRPLRRLGIVSGAGWDAITDPLVAAGEVDAVITGELIHQAANLAEDRDAEVFAIGHYASEVFGVQALGDELAQRFALEHQFIDLPTGL